MPLTQKMQTAMNLYAGIMAELKIRIRWLDYAAQGQTGMDARMVREFGFLQLRMCCELIALGCLVAHGDVKKTQSAKFRSAGNANDLMKELERLNPDCFPHAVVMRTLSPGSHHFDDRHESDHLTKAEFLRLYTRDCGSALHRGNIKNLLKPNQPIKRNFPELTGPAQKLIYLLECHKIALDGGYMQFICMLGNFDEDVRVVIGEAPRA